LFVVWDSDASCPGASYLVAQRANNEQPATKAQKLPFLKYKKYGQHDQSKANQVVPGQLIRFEDENGNEDKHRERNGFLNGFEFEQIERSPVTHVPDPVGRHLEDVLKKRQSPTDQNDGQQTQVLQSRDFFELEVAVPGKSHEHVRQDEQQNAVKAFHARKTTLFAYFPTINHAVMPPLDHTPHYYLNCSLFLPKQL
jgi:hypothetical protein